MKKITASLLVFTFAFSALFTGCAMTEAKAIKRYKESFEKMQKVEQCTMDTDMTMGMDISGLKIDIDMKIESALKEMGKKSSHTVEFSLFGQKQSIEVYQDGDTIYTTVPGVDGKYLKDSIMQPSGDTSVQGLAEINNIQNSMAYIDAIDKATEVTFEEKDDKSVLVSFDFTEESLEDLRAETVKILDEQILPAMEKQVHDQFEGLPLSEDEKKQMEASMIEAYRQMFTNLKIESIHMDRTISKEGYAIEQHMTMEMQFDLSGLLSILGEDVDSQTKEMMKSIGLDLELSNRVSNINEEINVEFPEFTDENTITSKDMMNLPE